MYRIYDICVAVWMYITIIAVAGCATLAVVAISIAVTAFFCHKRTTSKTSKDEKTRQSDEENGMLQGTYNTIEDEEDSGSPTSHKPLSSEGYLTVNNSGNRPIKELANHLKTRHGPLPSVTMGDLTTSNNEDFDIPKAAAGTKITFTKYSERLFK